MKSEFPLLSKLILEGHLAPLTPSVQLVDAQEATDRYWASQDEVIRTDGVLEMGRDLGCLAPPFPDLWIESTAVLPDDEEAGFFPLRIGYRVECKTFSEARASGFTNATAGVGWVYSFKAYDSVTGAIPGRGFLWTDESGVFMDYGYSVDGHDQQSVLGFLGKAAFFAISMMNCRNVELSTATTRERRGKKTRRKGHPSVEYKVIHLPKQRIAGSGNGEAGGSTKLHTARGHFKTYTADAPLMGKHTGTYYWGWQLRGKKENGEIVSTYKVGVPA